jgi:hypothetical protein
LDNFTRHQIYERDARPDHLSEDHAARAMLANCDRPARHERKRRDDAGADTGRDASMDLAEVLRMSGRPIEAGAAVEEALHLYERKGIVVSADRARAFLSELATARTGSPASAL